MTVSEADRRAAAAALSKAQSAASARHNPNQRPAVGQPPAEAKGPGGNRTGAGHRFVDVAGGPLRTFLFAHEVRVTRNPPAARRCASDEVDQRSAQWMNPG